MKKRFLSSLLAICMFFSLSVPVFAKDYINNEQDTVTIEVNDEQDILEFIFSDDFDPHVAYTFIYPDYSVVTQALCPDCGYNTLVGKTVEKYDTCHPGSQGQTVECPDIALCPDVFYVLLTYVYQYCNTCGYKGTETFSESKYYIECTWNEELYVATNYKTSSRLGCIHEWKDTWSLYYSDPHA